MTVEHKNITDANLHEVKGAASASANQLLVATGSGTALFKSASTLTLVSSSDVLGVTNTTPQTLTTTIATSGAVSAELPFVIGTSTTNANVSIDGANNLTIVTAGYYEIDLDLELQVSTASSALRVCAYKNGTLVRLYKGYGGVGASFKGPVTLQLHGYFNASDVITFKVQFTSEGATGTITGAINTTNIRVKNFVSIH